MVIVTKKETLVLIVKQPEHINQFGNHVGAWSGSLECKREDWTADQIISHAGNEDWIERILCIGVDGVRDITDEVLDRVEARA
jgi:hypothetical protein